MSTKAGQPHTSFAQDVAIAAWCFTPDRQIKPVHFANGFVRAVFGQAGSQKLLEAAGAGVRKGTSRVSTGQVLVDMRDRYVTDDPGRDMQAAQALRAALDLVLNQDRAFFAGGHFCSPTLTHFLHSTTDPSDRGAGRFMAELLAVDDSTGIIATLRNVLNRSDDNVYYLTAPLLSDKELGLPPEPGPGVRELAAIPVLEQLRSAFFRLVRHQSRLEKTVLLQRVISLACFGILLELFDRVPDGGTAPFVPLLVCGTGPADDVREASRASFARARQWIERVFEERLAEELRARNEHALSQDGYRELARSWLPNLDEDTRAGRRDATVWEQFLQDYDAVLLGSVTPFDAFRSAATRASFVALKVNGSEDPEGFAASLGRMIGLVYPRTAGAGEKYFLAAPQFLDMLVMALLDPGEDIPVDAFWQRAWEFFGLVSGGLGTLDHQRLAAWGIRQATPTSLDRNSGALLAELIRMGHAREYADDIAMIRAGGGLDA